MENYDNSISGPPFAGHFCHDVLVGHRKRGRNRAAGNNDLPLNDYFVYSSSNSEAPTGLSQAGKFYDMGNFQIASNGTQSATPAGELWVEHSWTMIRRKQSTPLGQELISAHWVEGPAATANAATTSFMGTSGGVLRTGSNWPGVCTKTTFTIPLVGYYLVAAGWTGTVTVAPTLTAGANLTGLMFLGDSVYPDLTTAASGLGMCMYLYNCTAAGTGTANTVTISGLTGLAAGTADVLIAQINGGITITKKTAIDTIMERLSAMEKRLLTTVREEPDSDFEEKSMSSSSSLSLDRSVHLSRDTVRTLLAAVK